MWVFYGLLPTLIILLILGGGVALLVRRGSEGWNVQFSSVLLAYVATAMLVGVFLVTAGAGLLLKAGFAEAGDRDFSYDVQPYPIYEPYPVYAPGEATPSKPSGSDEPTRTIDPSDSAIRDDVATGISLTFAGAVLFAVHAFGALVLRRREAQGAQVVTRAYNLVGLAVATLGFMGTGAQALNDVVRRYVVGGDTVEAWQVRHPGESLATAVVLLPLVLWFGWRVWQEMGAGVGREQVADGNGGATSEAR
ncbi:MAG: hypothetical protein EPO22_05780 [Dehalococcoidia bacterium]|nr:MAG: hypothetical protein EPO22_05780 [Dehalococcoidia bacterium]